MSIKFILDNTTLSKNRDELKNILESLKQKPVLRDYKANFLRRFMIASINTFKEETKETYHPEIKEIKIQAPDKLAIRIKPPQKLRLPLHKFLITPKKISIPQELLEETPDKEMTEKTQMIEEAHEKEPEEAPDKKLLEEAPEKNS